MRRLPVRRATSIVALPLFILMLLPSALRAQSSADASRDAAPCLRFRFGPWVPALDWTKAGHPGTADSFRIARADGGQAWAAGVPATTRTAPGDTVLVLYPAFWPVGVMVQFTPQAFAGRDTVRASATAFVADGTKTSPVSTVMLWKVPCG